MADARSPSKLKNFMFHAIVPVKHHTGKVCERFQVTNRRDCDNAPVRTPRSNGAKALRPNAKSADRQLESVATYFASQSAQFCVPRCVLVSLRPVFRGKSSPAGAHIECTAGQVMRGPSAHLGRFQRYSGTTWTQNCSFPMITGRKSPLSLHSWDQRCCTIPAPISSSSIVEPLPRIFPLKSSL